ncbi:hypothetical protein D3C79_926670 [compost metagenome]
MSDILRQGGIQMGIGSENKDVADQKVKEHLVRKNNGNHLLDRNGTGRIPGYGFIFDAEDNQDEGVKEINSSAQHKRQQ